MHVETINYGHIRSQMKFGSLFFRLTTSALRRTPKPNSDSDSIGVGFRFGVATKKFPESKSESDW